MAGFLQWLASQRRDVLEGLNERIVELRKDFIDKAPHLHIATSLAQLLGRFEILLKFACDVGAIDSDVVNKLREKAHQALSKVGASSATRRSALRVSPKPIDSSAPAETSTAK